MTYFIEEEKKNKTFYGTDTQSHNKHRYISCNYIHEK